MTWTVPQITRDRIPRIAGERAALQGWLTYHRQALLAKCAGLTGEQLKIASVPPSNLTLLGLVRHLAEVERYWFRQRLAGERLGQLYCTEQFPDGDFDLVAGADAQADYATLVAETAAADAAAAGRSLEDTFEHPRWGSMNVRWLYLHMIEEYARHNGHADLIRERIDGVTGS